MTKEQIAQILKASRNNAGLSPGEVVEKLKNFDITISEKTLYGYENGHSSPQISTLFRLCEIYGIEDVSGTFGFEPKRSSYISTSPTDEDLKFALFNGDGDITDEMYEEVKAFAEFVKQRERGKKDEKSS